jgi:hypothetical protein
MDRQSLSLVGKSIGKVASRVIRPMNGTVSTAMAVWSQTGVVLDSDPSERQVAAVSLIGPLPAGARVFCLAYPPSGLVILGLLGFEAPSVQPFTTPGTFEWAVPSNLLGVTIEIQAGGGGSGGASATLAGNTSPSAGGQGGGYSRAWVPRALLGAELTLIVPTGGTAGAAGNNAGGTGGTAFVSSPTALLLSATGGAGGAGAASGTAPATSNGGTGAQTFAGIITDNRINVQGSDGKQGVRHSGTFAVGGDGGSSFLGGAVHHTNTASGGAGIAGYTYGGGAAGARGIGASAALAGAIGGSGAIIITPRFT